MARERDPTTLEPQPVCLVELFDNPMTQEVCVADERSEDDCSAHTPRNAASIDWQCGMNGSARQTS